MTKHNYTHTHTTVKQMKDWLNQFNEDEVVYLSSFNSLCGGGYYNLTSQFIHKEDTVQETKNIPYLSDESGIQSYDTATELLQRCIKNQELPSQRAECQEKYIEKNKQGWNDNKLTQELNILNELRNTKDEEFLVDHKVPVIFINN